MPFDPANAAQRIHQLGNAVAAQAANVTTIHNALTASGLHPPVGSPVNEAAAAYAQMMQRLPQVLQDHPEIGPALNALHGQVTSAEGQIEPAVDWELVGYIVICIVLCA